MNKFGKFAIAGLACLTLAISGCVSMTEGRPSASGEPTPQRTVPCNLGAGPDATTGKIRARYDSPLGGDQYRKLYGPWVANDSCTDSAVFAWQKLRRANGESDAICRIVYEYDNPMDTVYSVGCAVPVMVVTNAP